MPLVSEMFPKFPTRVQTLGHYVGKACAVEWLLAKRLPDKDFAEYLEILDDAQAGLYIDDDMNKEVAASEADVRTNLCLERLSMSTDFDTPQFSLNELRVVEKLVLE